MNFVGKIALVTGASRGIGKVIAKELAKNGAKVIGTATSKSGVEIINSNLGIGHKGILLDVANFSSIAYVLEEIRSEFGEIDILVNNAGIVRDDLFLKMSGKEWNDVLNVNLTSIFYLSKAVVRAMVRKRTGRIINISSVIGFIGNVGQTNYAAAKAGIIGFSKSLAKEVASRGVTVNVVSPGFIETDMTKKLNRDKKLNILTNIPVGRFGDSQDVAYAVLFLASDKASYITGETLHVNGGIYMP